jgi:hypothetical protein
MADLVTHVGLALLVKAVTGRRHSASFVLGNVLPDLAGRAVGMGLTLLAHRGLPVPEGLIFGFGVLHLPLGMIAFCGLLALPFRPDSRWRVFANLAGGCFLHLAVDLLQRHTGTGYPLIFPFSSWHWEAGLIGSEATVPWALPLLALGLGAWWWRRSRDSAVDERAHEA